MTHKFREEVLNVQLAELFTEQQLAATPETIRGRALPDVLVSLGGLKLIVEGRRATQKKSLFDDARERVAEGVADLSMAVLYGQGLNTAGSLKELRDKLRAATYSGALFYFARGKITEQEFDGVAIPDLATLINHAFNLTVQNDVVREQVAEMETAIEGVVRDASSSDLFFESTALLERLRKAIGIPEDDEDDKDAD
jgi:hypothetical protein